MIINTNLRVGYMYVFLVPFKCSLLTASVRRPLNVWRTLDAMRMPSVVVSELFLQMGMSSLTEAYPSSGRGSPAVPVLSPVGDFMLFPSVKIVIILSNCSGRFLASHFKRISSKVNVFLEITSLRGNRLSN